MPFPLLAAGLAAGAAGSLMSAFGTKKVKMPAYVPPDLEGVSASTAASNLKQLPNVQRAESAMNTFRTEELQKMLESVSPGLGKLSESATRAIQSMVSGELTAGEEQMLGQKSAAWAAAAGVPQSGMALNQRLFGYSQAMQQRITQGLSAANQWIQTARSAMTPGMADYSGMFMTSASQARQEAMQISQLQYQGAVGQAQAAAQPNPFLTAAGGFMSNVGGVMAGAGAQKMANDSMWKNISKMYGSGSVSGGII